MEIVVKNIIQLPTQKVLAVAFHPDGKILAAGDRDGIIHIIDVESGEVIRHLKQHIGFVYALTFNPDNGHLFSAGKDKSICEWDIESGTFLHDYAGIFQGVHARSMASQNCRQAKNGHSMTVLSICCEKGGIMATSGQDCKVKFWRNGELLRTYDWHTKPVPCIRFQPGTHVLFSASKDKTIRSWNEVTGAVIHKYSAHLAAICGLEFIDMDKFLSVDISGQIIAWTADSESFVNTLYQAPRRLMCANICRDRQQMILGAEDGTIEVVHYDPEADYGDHAPERSSLCTMRIHTSEVRCIDLHDGLIASCDNSGKVALFNVQ